MDNIDTIIQEVLNNSFNAIDITEFDKYEEPTNEGKNMSLWYEQMHGVGKSSDCEGDSGHCTASNTEISSNQPSGDPDEAIYCICQSTSNGEPMVGCDGPTCKYEWFHFSCVGLPWNWTSTDDWFCPECSAKIR